MPQPVLAQAPSYRQELVLKAEAAGIGRDAQWLALLHYKAGSSLIDDPKFFLSASGRRDPEAELVSTLEGFLSTDMAGDAHPRCRFPLRYEWLKARIGFDEARMPALQCAGYDDYMAKLDPRSAVLVFPESHMNSPASMFGHTLIRIDSRLESKLLSYAVSYAATTDETMGLFFAFKGIFGLYPGYYSILPYHEKIKEYSFMENRDLWEYKLDLTGDEVRRMAMHIWELNGIYSDYFFFDENCAYILLFLVDVVRPGMDLTDGFFYWIVPVDTIRAAKRHGLILDSNYRPSRAATIKHIASITSQSDQSTAREVALGRMAAREVLDNAALDPDAKARNLDQASEFHQYRFTRQETEKDEYSGRYIDILSARSTLGRHDYDIPAPASPADGHGSSRVAVGLGAVNGQPYVSLRFRPAYHDLTDDNSGYVRGGAISFMDTEARYYARQGRLRLSELMLIDIESLSGRDTFFAPVSWKVNTGVVTEQTSLNDDRLLYVLNAFGGYSYDTRAGIIFGMFGPAIKAGAGLDGCCAAGAGVTAGIIISYDERWRALLRAGARDFFLGDTHTQYGIHLGQALSLNRNLAVKLDLGHEVLDRFHTTDIKLSFHYYF